MRSPFHVYCKNVGYDTVSTLVKTLERGLVLELLEDELEPRL